LAQHEGFLGLPGLTSLSEAAAQALTQHKGDLWLNGKAEEAVEASKTGSVAKTERYFEFKDNQSAKFWGIRVQVCKVTVHFGKIGGSGQTRSKSFKDEITAQAHAERLVKEKTRKGYNETPGA